MRCTECGTDVGPGVRFCGRCGSELPRVGATGSDLGGSDRDPGSENKPQPGTVLAPWEPGASGGPLRPAAREEEPGRPGGGGPSSQFGMPLAPWVRRVAALLIDVVVLLGIAYVLTFVAIVVLGIHSLPARSARPPTWLMSMVVVAQAVYFVVMGGNAAGQTVGYRVVGISVRDATGGTRIGMGRAFVRYGVRSALYGVFLLSGVLPQGAWDALFLLPGVANDLFPLWDRSRQTIADKVVHAVVVSRN